MLSETLFYPTTAVDSVLTCDASVARDLAPLLQRYGLELVFVDDATDIPGSYWGDRQPGHRAIRYADTFRTARGMSLRVYGTAPTPVPAHRRRRRLHGGKCGMLFTSTACRRATENGP